MGFFRRLFGGKTNSESDTAENTLTLITHINQRSLNAMVKTQGEDYDGMGKQTTMAIQLLREYGYGANTLIRNGDGQLLFKAFDFTKACVSQDLLESRDGGFDSSGRLADPAGAIKLFSEIFTPAEVEAIRYEITGAKPRDGDSRRDELLRKAGYDASGGLMLTTRWESAK